MKCSPAGWCAALDERLSDYPNARAKGLTTIEVWNHLACRVEVAGIAYKLKASDAGLMLNWCPFCGAAIDFGFRDALEPLPEGEVSP